MHRFFVTSVFRRVGFWVWLSGKNANVRAGALACAGLLLLAAASCSPDGEQPAEPLAAPPKLSTSQLLPVLADVHMAENLVRDKRLERDTTFALYDIAYYYEQICAMHHVDAGDLKQAIEYYTARPKELKGLYDELEKYMKKMEAQYKDAKPATAADSPTKVAEKPAPTLPLGKKRPLSGKKPAPEGK